ncbi:right-handed parallel beta-helix repeat-containing protein [Candidatus Caldatribacterium saccharofermentans]|uniref:right-handed parallel beta-helix repeat-containing protein n=1 Tax=Candidatus Caldatribacterium saccharofermentans TaxID=1454753 RepID=UPI003CFFBA26
MAFEDTLKNGLTRLLTASRGEEKPSPEEEGALSFRDFRPVFPEEPLVPSGGFVVFHPGDYVLRDQVVLTPPFFLVGMKGTVLFRDGEVVRVEGRGEGRVRGVAFSLRGRHKGNVAVVLQGRVVFEECLFRGGVREKLSWMGNGVVVAKGASCIFRRCVFLRNEAAGILVESGSRITVEDSLFLENGGEGILLRRGAVAVVRNSRFIRNAWGVTCGSLLLFEGNEVLEHTVGGMCFLREAEGIFAGNRIAENPLGVMQSRNSRVIWGTNLLEGNRVALLEE